MLLEFLAMNNDEIITRARAMVAKRSSRPPKLVELENGVPVFLKQLADRLSLATKDDVAIEATATKNGGELEKLGFTVGQVVHGYGDVCQAVTELAEFKKAHITAGEFRTFNLCLDDAIAEAVTEYGRRRERTITRESTERLDSLAHELRNQIASAILSFNLLKKGNVALGGCTGAVLGRSLRGLRDLVNESLTEVRLESGVQRRQRVSVFDTIGEVEIEASLDASSRGFDLSVAPGERDVDVESDPHILAAAVGSLLQNAFRLTPPNGHVALRATATSDRVLIEVEDERGALPPALVEELSRPLEQQAPNGTSFGLSICRKSVAALGGEMRVHALAGSGCVFTIDLPRRAQP